MNRELLRPRQAAEIKTVLLGRKLKLTSKGRELNKSVGNRRLILKDDVNFMEMASDRRKGHFSQGRNNCGDPGSLFFHASGKDDTGRIIVDLAPMDGRIDTSKLLGADNRKKHARAKKQNQAALYHCSTPYSILKLADNAQRKNF